MPSDGLVPPFGFYRTLFLGEFWKIQQIGVGAKAAPKGIWRLIIFLITVILLSSLMIEPAFLAQPARRVFQFRFGEGAALLFFLLMSTGSIASVLDIYYPYKETHRRWRQAVRLFIVSFWILFLPAFVLTLLKTKFIPTL